MNENDFEDFLKAQKQSASPRRLEMLEKDLSGTKKMRVYAYVLEDKARKLRL